MIGKPDAANKLALDARGLDQLRQSAKQNSPEAIKGAAQQFEALFLNMVLKSMREATPQDGLFDSQQQKMLTGMLDQQLSQNLSKRGIGLADALVRQLTPKTQGQSTISQPGVGQLTAKVLGENQPAISRPGDPLTADAPSGATYPNAKQVAAGNYNVNRAAAVAAAAAAVNAGAASSTAINPTDIDIPLRPLAPGRLGNSAAARMYYEAARLRLELADLPSAPGNTQLAEDARARGSARPQHVRDFQERLNVYAEQVSRETGIPAKFMIGQAALESGWGKKEITTANGSQSFNIFGIKATSGWKGKVTEAVTTEYVNGVAHTKRERFRVYDSYADAFRDYAKLLSKNPRYEQVIANAQDAGSFAQGLQRAGYATDPQYANKLTRIIKNSLI